MHNQLAVTDEGKKIINLLGKFRLIAQKRITYACYVRRPLRHWALRIEITLKSSSGGHLVLNFKTADFDNSITIIRTYAGGFCIEDNFSHLTRSVKLASLCR